MDISKLLIGLSDFINAWGNNVFVGVVATFIFGWIFVTLKPILVFGWIIRYIDLYFANKLKPELKAKWNEQYKELEKIIDECEAD